MADILQEKARFPYPDFEAAVDADHPQEYGEVRRCWRCKKGHPHGDYTSAYQCDMWDTSRKKSSDDG